MLATAGRNGATRAFLVAHGFGVSLIASLVNQGFATLTYEKVRTGIKMIDVGKVRITEAGRAAIEG
jgi:hypothetical protein